MKNIQLQRHFLLALRLIHRGVGVFISESGVQAAEVKRTGSGFVLDRFAAEPFAAGTEDLAPAEQREVVSKAVASCLKQVGMKIGHLFSSPSSSKVVTRFFRMPILPKKERKQAVRFEGARFVPYKLDETVFDYYERPSGPENQMEVVFNAIQINTLKEHVQEIEADSGCKVMETEPSFYSLVRSVQGIVDLTNAVLIAYFSAGGHVSLCLLKNRMMYVCRDFFVTDPDKSGTDKFFAEVRSSMEYFEHLTGISQLPHIMIGGDGDLVSWKKQLENYFQKSVEVSVAVFPVKKGVGDEKSSAFLIPIGLALRALGVKCVAGEISLLSSGPVAEERFAPRRWTSIAILSLLLVGVIFYFGYFIPRMKLLEKKLTVLSQKVSEIISQVPEFSKETAGQLEKRVNDIESKTRIIQAFQSSQSLLGEKLSVLSKTIPAFIWFSDFSYEEKIGTGGVLQVAGRKLIVHGFVYYREIPEEELRQVNEYADLLKRTAEFMVGFQDFKLEGVERINYRGRNFTKFTITCSKS